MISCRPAGEACPRCGAEMLHYTDYGEWEEWLGCPRCGFKIIVVTDPRDWARELEEEEEEDEEEWDP